MHINKGKTVAQCITDRTDYAINPDKTNNGELVSCYACDYRTIDAEFALSKRQYRHLTGKDEKNDVIAYQVRQSFKPGEVSPEEAKQIGYDFASRFLKGKHAFVVCTHIDKAHIHNHIIWNSITLDCARKFRNFYGSARAVARLSDLICTEHQLSVIQNPQRGGTSYPDVMSIDQMCEILSVSTKTGYKIIKEGSICCLKVGRAYRIPKAHLLTYLCIGLNSTASPVEM